MPDNSVLRQRKLLIVEDERIVAMDLELSLRNLGFEVVGVANGAQEAIKLAESTAVDLVLMDIDLPGKLDGIAAAAEIRRERDVPVLFISAFTHAEMQDRARQVSPYGYLRKPFRQEQLLSMVQNALDDSTEVRLQRLG